MSASTGTIKVSLQIDEKGTVKVLKSVGAESKNAGKKGKEAFDKMDKSAKGFSKTGKKVSSVMLKIGAAAGVVVGVLGLAAALRKLTNATKEYVGLANVQEEAETDLQAVLTSTGHAAGFNIEQLKSMASGMQDITRVGDETTLAGMSILATFKQIRGEAFERSTVAALDMSQVLKQDLKSSMIMIGKAVNDPIRGLTSLGRAGITFTEGQKDMIKAMQESGDTAGAQSLILAELESQFGGAAEAASKTFAGGMDQAGNALGDVKEELGFVITKNQFFIELTHLATEEFKSWGKYINENREDLMLLAKNGVGTLMDHLEVGLEVLKFFHNAWQDIKIVAQLALHGITIALDETYPLIKNFLKPIDLLFDGLVKLGKMDVNPLDSMPQMLADFRSSTGAVLKDMEADLAANNKRWDLAIKKVQEFGTAIRKIDTGVADPIEIKAKVIVDTDGGFKGFSKEILAYSKLKNWQHKILTDMWQFRRQGMQEITQEEIEASTAYKEAVQANLEGIGAGFGELYSNLNDKPFWAKFQEGANNAMENIKTSVMSTAEIVEYGLTNAVDGVANAFGAWASRTKSFKDAFSDMAKNVLGELASMIAKQAIYNALASGSNGGGGSSGGGFWSSFLSNVVGSMFHTGGIVGSGEGNGMRMMPAMAFEGAPRFHSGLLPGEYAAILKKDEGVFTPKQMEALGRNSQPSQQPREIRVTNTFYVTPDNRGNISKKSQQQIANSAYKGMNKAARRR